MARIWAAGSLIVLTTVSAVAGADEAANAAVPDPRNYGGASLTAVSYGMAGMSALGSTEWDYSAGTTLSGWFSLFAGSATIARAKCANVHIPTGSILEGITTVTNDTDPGADVSYRLLDTDLQTGVGVSPWFFSTGGPATPGIERTFRPLTPPITVRNDHVYVLCIIHTALGTSLQSGGATVWYRLQVSPAPAVATFPNDVPTSHPMFRFVEALAAAGITGGCGAGSYCPEAPLTRGQMAVFLSVALGLHFPN